MTTQSTSQGSTDIRLFEAHSTLPEIRSRRNVEVDWYVVKRDKPHISDFRSIVIWEHPHHDDVGDSNSSTRTALDQYLTEEEARLLGAHLRTQGIMLNVTEVELPIRIKEWGLSPMDEGWEHPLEGTLTVNDLADYDLPFHVEGFYDLRGCEVVDRRDPKRHMIFQIYNENVHTDPKLKRNFLICAELAKDLMSYIEIERCVGISDGSIKPRRGGKSASWASIHDVKLEDPEVIVERSREINDSAAIRLSRFLVYCEELFQSEDSLIVRSLADDLTMKDQAILLLGEETARKLGEHIGCDASDEDYELDRGFF